MSAALLHLPGSPPPFAVMAGLNLTPAEVQDAAGGYKRLPNIQCFTGASRHRATLLIFSVVRSPASPSKPDKMTHKASVSSIGGGLNADGIHPCA